ncbi:hypothetical protein LCGC14_2795960 [marine sediment metagenome]|uniref:Uncharacterized protein n=1 Tax=marine sediment metagenome TaxID=412755 RepID=A0A0F8YP66_9ZZZZ
MFIRENDNAKFIRRRDAAIKYLKRLLDEGKLSDEEVLEATTDKFSLSPSIRNDYRIYGYLWDIIGS